MRGSISKTSLKKQTSLDNNRPMFGAKTIFMAHEATSGDTGIDLTSLSMPTSLYEKGYRNPSQKEIEELNLSFYSNYLKIVSTTKNELMKVSYDVVSGTQINFDGWTAEAGEIFELTFASPPSGGSQYFDAKPIVKTYLLPEGDTEVIVDDFEINKFPDYQMGSVMVQRSVSGLPVTQLRNVGNSPSGEGNYYEVAGVAGVSKVIKFNTAGPVGGDVVIITSIGALVQAPQQTFLSYIETINGAQQKIIDGMVALGYSREDFEALPNNVDLATFGNKVNALESIKDVEIQKYDEEILEMNGSSQGSSYDTKFVNTQSDTSNYLLSLDNSGAFTKVYFLKDTLVHLEYNTSLTNASNQIIIHIMDANDVTNRDYNADYSAYNLGISVSTLVTAGQYVYFGAQNGAANVATRTYFSIVAKSFDKITIGERLS